MVKVETQADKDVEACLDGEVSFALIAGAGSGKTSSLIDALEWVREHKGKDLRQNGQRVACITYTKRAVAVISERLGFDDLYLHFVGQEQERFIDAFGEQVLPALRG